MPRATRIYLLYTTVSAALFWMVFTVNSIYFVTVAKLDPLQLVLVGTALELSVFLFEVPTGIVADVVSRRLSVIIGVFLIGAGFLLTGAVPHFWPIVAAQALWGVGYTFTSGALQAWISDEIGEEHAAAAFLRAAHWEQWGALAGIGLSVGLAGWSLQAPILAGGALFFPLGVFLIAFMPEHGFKPTPAAERGTARRMIDTLRSGVGMTRRRPVLLLILGVGFFYGLYSEGFDRLWTAHMLERFVFPTWGGLSSVTWFGILQAGAMLLTALATGWLSRRLGNPRPETLARAMSVTSTLLVAGLVGFALAGQFLAAVALYWAISVLRQVNYPLYTAWVNHRVDPQVRATVISLSSQVDAFGQIGGGPLVGALARATTLQTGLLGSAALLAPVLGLLLRIVRGAGESTGDPTVSPQMETDGG